MSEEGTKHYYSPSDVDYLKQRRHPNTVHFITDADEASKRSFSWEMEKDKAYREAVE